MNPIKSFPICLSTSVTIYKPSRIYIAWEDINRDFRTMVFAKNRVRER